MKSGTRKSPRKSARYSSTLSVVTPAAAAPTTTSGGDDLFNSRTAGDTSIVVTPIAKGGVACPFPWRLHEMLEFVHKNEMEHIASWDKKGKAFTVHDSKAFVIRILPRFFSQTKYASFQRQLNLYGFSRKRSETSLSCYYHPYFLRADPDLVRNMVRCKIKGTGKNRQGSPKPISISKKGRDKRVTQPPVAAVDVAPLVTPIRLVSNSSTSSSSVDDDVESVVVSANEDSVSVVSTLEPFGPTSSTDIPLVGSSSLSYYDSDYMAHHHPDSMVPEDMVFFEGSPFHLLESEQQAGAMLLSDHNADSTAHYYHHSTMALAPTLPYASFRADGGTGLPRMKLQPRASSISTSIYYGTTSSMPLSGADYMATYIR